MKKEESAFGTRTGGYTTKKNYFQNRRGLSEMHNRIAIFGLTGDPFTIAHRDICKQAMDTLKIDKLYVIPTVVDYHRKDKERWLTDLQRVYCIEKMLWTLGNEYREKYEIDTHELMLKSLCENDTRLYNEIIKPPSIATV